MGRLVECRTWQQLGVVYLNVEHISAIMIMPHDKSVAVRLMGQTGAEMWRLEANWEGHDTLQELKDAIPAKTLTTASLQDLANMMPP